MIEQTELKVTEWEYNEPTSPKEGEKIIASTTLEVMRKRAATKKGLACRFTAIFNIGEDVVLNYVGEDSYVIDLDDKVDKVELLRMIRNSFSKFNDAYELRKLSTLLHNKVLSPLDETQVDLDRILPLLD
jgi:hypothetical protein